MLSAVLCVSLIGTAPEAARARFRQRLCSRPDAIRAQEVSGAFDLIVQISAKDFAEYRSLADHVFADAADVVARVEASFAEARQPAASHDGGMGRAFWIRRGADHVRIDWADIEMITAEGDYVRLHVGGDTWLLHRTIKDVADLLAAYNFVRVHRSTLIRRDVIVRLSHEKRCWVAVLRDGGRVPIARRHAAAAGALLQG